jgi:hypothetical protein
MGEVMGEGVASWCSRECHVVERAKCNGGSVYDTSCRNGDKGGGMYYDNNGKGMCQLKQPQQWWWRVLGWYDSHSHGSRHRAQQLQ